MDGGRVQGREKHPDSQSRWREDKVTDGGYPADVVKNAPEAVEHFFAVPKVVE